MRKFHLLALAIIFLGNCLLAQNRDDQQVLELVRKNAFRLHLTQEDVNNAIVSSSYVDQKTNIRYVYLQQAQSNIKVFNSIMTIIFRDGDVLYASGSFVPGLSANSGEVRPNLLADVAIATVAKYLQLKGPSALELIQDLENAHKLIFSNGGIAKKEIEAELFWVADAERSKVRLAWNINIDVLGSADWWNVRVDANTGEIIERDNWTVHEAETNNHKVTGTDHSSGEQYRYSPPPTVTSGSYYVVPFPYESPLYHAFQTETQPWLKAGAGNAAITNGWHFDGTTNYNITRGNNVFAYLDVASPSNAPNANTNWPDTSSTANPSLTFGSNPVFTQQPSLKANRKAAVTNLFYWNNIVHDVTYQYGFNELSGNFQTDNMGRGGSGNDYVQAEAQDFGGTNNANFSTPVDGSRPRMQMYLWTGRPAVLVTAPASIAGGYAAVESAFSTANKLANLGAISGPVVYFNDVNGSTHDACSGPPANSLTGKIALINRSSCSFTIKVKEAQLAGAIGVIMVNNIAGDPITMGGTDNTITIPAVMISQNDGAILAGELANGLTATLSPPISRDGDFDNGIIVHEYGHGVSNRLTGGPANSSCLGNAEQGGEGWSDYLALMLTTDWSTAQLTSGPVARPVGNYATSQSTNGGGIRNFPYSTNMSVNPLTYADMNATNSESHFIGEIWCSALWDMTWNIIQQSGNIETNLYNGTSNGGNAIALRLVLEGMRLQPCQPGFLDARDAILAADSILYNGSHKCSIWRAFARRGMGYSAKQGSSSSAADQTAAYDIPGAVYLSKSSAPLLMTPGSQQAVNISASCQCQVPSNGYTIRDTIPNGFTYVSSTGGVLNGNVVSFSSLNFTTEMETKNFSVTIQATGGGCIIDTAINDNRNITIGGLTSSSLASSAVAPVLPAQWAASTLRSKSPSSSWRAVNSSTSEDFVLTSAPFLAGNLSVLSFWHYYVTEKGFDGGTVEISTNGGTSWFDASPYTLQNGYNTTMETGAPWSAGQKAFSGSSYAQGNSQFINTVINLSQFSGQSLKVRFRMRTDVGNPGSIEGWFIDDILQMNGCGGVVRTGLYNASNVKIDSAAVPVFVKSSGLPTTILSHPSAISVCPGSNPSFAVAATGGTLTYQWQVSTDGGVNYANIPGATSSSLNLTGTSTSMNGYLYRCIVDNGSNAATTQSALLTVNSITSVGALNNVSVCEGTTALFASNASGGNLTYQWQASTDGVTFTNIAGATNSSYSIDNTSNSQNGTKYRVLVTGTCGNATSPSATLTVNSVPLVTISAAASEVCPYDGAVMLTPSQTGGIWTGPGVSGTQFSPVGLSAGPYHITYTLTNSYGCTGIAATDITVKNCADRNLSLGQQGAIIIRHNPSGGDFEVQFKTDRYQQVLLKVFEADGKLVYQKTEQGISYGVIRPVMLKNLAAGIYFLSIYDEKTGDEKTFRLLIAR